MNIGDAIELAETRLCNATYSENAVPAEAKFYSLCVKALEEYRWRYCPTKSQKLLKEVLDGWYDGLIGKEIWSAVPFKDGTPRKGYVSWFDDGWYGCGFPGWSTAFAFRSEDIGKTVFLCEPDEMVVAWMPLPEPPV